VNGEGGGLKRALSQPSIPGVSEDRSFQNCGVDGISSSEGVMVPLQPSSRAQGWLMGVVRWELMAEAVSEPSSVGVEGKKYISEALEASRPSRVGDDGVRRPDDFWRASAVSAWGAWMLDSRGDEYIMEDGKGMVRVQLGGERSMHAAFCWGESPVGGWLTNWPCGLEWWLVVAGL